MLDSSLSFWKYLFECAWSKKKVLKELHSTLFFYCNMKSLKSNVQKSLSLRDELKKYLMFSISIKKRSLLVMEILVQKLI